MGAHPIQQRFVGHRAVRHAQTDGDNVVVGAGDVETVDGKEGQHNEDADTLVAVHESVVGDQRVAEARAFLSSDRQRGEERVPYGALARCGAANCI